jgi:two-component system, cell cycle response regulator
MSVAIWPAKTTGLLVCLAVGMLTMSASVLAANEPVTAEQLKQLPDHPAEYEALPYPKRIDWLQAQLDKADSPARRYQLSRDLAFQHFYNYAHDKAQQICRERAALAFDLDYRYLCASTDEENYHESIRQLLAVHDDAIAADNINLATQALSGVAWKQSSGGDIAGAFRSYERAMALAERADVGVLNDVMVNTATLYVIHGDREYTQKGVELLQAAIARFETMKQEEPNAAAYADEMLSLMRHNVGIAYALHLFEYDRALRWLEQVDPKYQELRRSTLVFSALAAAELKQKDAAQRWLTASLQAPRSTQVNTDYLDCYQQLVQVQLRGFGELERCSKLPAQTPLEVSLDLYKRMAAMNAPDWRLVGLEKLHELFVNKLEAQLKQSSTQAASHAELGRLQLESKLKSELIEKEQALKRAEQEKRQSQTLLTTAAAAILLLIILVIINQLRQNRKLAKQYESLSVLDGLTGLHNRRYFEQNIDRELNYVKRSQRDGTGHTVALYLFDIDHFKKINDSHGHDVGDEVIVEFARRIKAAIRETDMLIRWGGEEFLLVARLDQTGEFHRVAERIRAVATQQPFTISKQLSLTVSCTTGAAVYPHAEGQTIDIHWSKLLQLADAALYLGKRKQRNTWVCIDNILDLAALDQILEQDLELSAQKRQLMISSQFDLA